MKLLNKIFKKKAPETETEKTKPKKTSKNFFNHINLKNMKIAPKLLIGFFIIAFLGAWMGFNGSKRP